MELRVSNVEMNPLTSLEGPAGVSTDPPHCQSAAGS